MGKLRRERRKGERRGEKGEGKRREEERRGEGRKGRRVESEKNKGKRTDRHRQRYRHRGRDFFRPKYPCYSLYNKYLLSHLFAFLKLV